MATSVTIPPSPKPVNEDHDLPILPKVTKPEQNHNLQNHEETSSKPGTYEVTTRHDWVISIRDKLEHANIDDDITSWAKLCIYKVPHYLHDNDNKKSYFPQTVSLGPYHHGKEQIRSMEFHKWRAVNKVLKRTNQGIEMYIDAMTELEEKARACYEGPIMLSSTEFTEMLVLDGCFVLELFRGVSKGFSELGYAHNDPIFAIGESMHSIQCDMIMLENQLPLFVLSRLLELQRGKDDQTKKVARLTVRFFQPLMPRSKSLTNTYQSRIQSRIQRIVFESHPFANSGGLHCLNVFRRSLLLPKMESRSSEKRWDWEEYSRVVADKHRQQMIRCVTKLRLEGFNFRKRETDRFWDIQFNNSYLEIPTLVIHDGTKALFLNLIAFEQRHVGSSKHITSYIIFMSNLIDSPKDVKYMHCCGIIEHSLRSDSEVVDMFNRLCKEVVFNTNDCYLSQLLIEVRQYKKHNNVRKWNAWKASLKLIYIDNPNPWAYISFIVAVLLLILTFSQSYFAAYAYYKTPS